MSVESPPLPGAERALRDSEIRLQQVLDNTSALAFAKDSQGRYLFVNREFEKLTDRDAAEILGRTDEEVFTPALATRFRYNDLRVLQERRAIEFEEVVNFGSATRIFLSSKFPLIDSQGVAYAVCGIATDITERKRLEDALSAAALAVSQSEEETLYRQLARYLSTILGVDGAFIATLEPGKAGELRMQAFCLDGEVVENFTYPQTGTPCETVVGHGYRFYGSRLKELFPIDLDFAKLGLESYAGFPLADAQGQSLGLIAVVSRRPLENPAFVESVLRIFAVRINAELERATAAQALRASEANYRQIFEASEDSIFVHDWETGAILDVNPRACQTYGYAREELVRIPVGELGGGEAPYSEADAIRWLEQAKRTGSARFEWLRRNKDGSLHWDEVRLTSARIGGQPRVLAITRDISERKAAEQERTRLEAQLRQAQKMEAIGQLTGGIAHDFNNLLTSIMGYVALAGERESALADVRLGGYLAQARRSCERARDLIQQMLMFSRGHRGSPRTVSLAPVIRGALTTLRAGLRGTLELVVETEETADPVHVDPAQVEQVLLNLCINARDALGGSGLVRVGVRPLQREPLVCAGCRATIAGSFVELYVDDDGEGMTPDVMEHIFEPFFSTKESGKGSGMGLAMVHGIVHEHGGHVVVTSSPGKGASFRVLWPALPGDQLAVEGDGDRGREARPVRTALRGSVLVVDDEETVGEFMRELLGTWGLQAVSVSRPETALDLVGSAPARFDVVITDQSMPRMTGLELARRLKQLRVDLPVILYTGFGDGLAGDDVDTARLFAVMRKPVDPGELSQALTRCLERQSPR